MTMTFFLCRPTLSLTSGAGQLIRGQARALRASGKRVTLCCRRGGFKFFLRTGFIARRPPRDLETLAASPKSFVVDHGMRLRYADMVFVHNCASEAVRHLDRDDWRAAAAEESEFFRRLNPEAVVVANSELVRRALSEHFGLEGGRVRVERPGFRRDRFARGSAEALRRAARRALGLEARTPVIGLVTSGDFRKRGLDIFLDAGAAIAAARPEVRFLVVGSKRLPAWAAQHALVRSGRVVYRPKSSHPERWFAALDLFLYPARFEEFGLVVTEALALGIPVLTSRCVGASECLPSGYAPWLLDRPDAATFAEKAIALLADAEGRGHLGELGELGALGALGELGARSVAGLDDERYVRSTVSLMLDRARLKAGSS
jgi:glycosyltransferase involved in cell wall biosynthesis